MFQCGALRAGFTTSGSWRWTREGEEIASVAYLATLGDDAGTLTLDYSQHDRNTGDSKVIVCSILLVTLPCRYGGRIWYFICPYTGRRARKLYKWGPIDWFCHREAIKPKPTYASQRCGGSDRIMAQRWALRYKLGDQYSDLFDEPMKPKWMRWRTFQRYLDRDAELDARESVYFVRLFGRLSLRVEAAEGAD